MPFDTTVVSRNIIFLRGFVAGAIVTLCVSTIYLNVIVVPNKQFTPFLSPSRWEDDARSHRVLESDNEIGNKNGTHVSSQKSTEEELLWSFDIDSVANDKNELNDIEIDHVVMKSISASTFAKTLDFWSSNFELEVEGRQESRAFEKNPHRSMPSYPSVHLNSQTQLDFFPREMALFYGKGPRDFDDDTTEAANVDEVVDHVALRLSGQKMVKVLENFRHNGVKIETAVGDYIGEDQEGMPMFWGPWGARGKAIGVFLYDPNGMYIELRTYDLGFKDTIDGIVKDLKLGGAKKNKPVEE